ncbi:hypothetical protein WDZ92_15735 [Nostoc sp. NIES-2111]
MKAWISIACVLLSSIKANGETLRINVIDQLGNPAEKSWVQIQALDGRHGLPIFESDLGEGASMVVANLHSGSFRVCAGGQKYLITCVISVRPGLGGREQIAISLVREFHDKPFKFPSVPVIVFGSISEHIVKDGVTDLEVCELGIQKTDEATCGEISRSGAYALELSPGENTICLRRLSSKVILWKKTIQVPRSRFYSVSP